MGRDHTGEIVLGMKWVQFFRILEKYLMELVRVSIETSDDL